MIQIAVVEDDKHFSSILCDYLERYSTQYGVSFSITKYTDGYAIVDGYSHMFDIILMDIEMGLMNGMEAAREIRKIDEDVIIIFITNMAQFAIQGYSVSALDYVLKPINYTAFSESLKKGIARLHKRTDTFLPIIRKGGTLRLKASDILYVESLGHRLTFHTVNENYETTVYSLTQVEEQLSADGFMRASSGTLVNLGKVSGIQNGSVLVNGHTIFLSRSRKNAFMSALVSRMME